MAAKPITEESAGPRVKKLQKHVKAGLKKRGFEKWAKGIVVDGKPGPMTFEMSARLASMRGLPKAQVHKARLGRITPQVEHVLNGEVERTAAMKKREHERRGRWKKVRWHVLHPPEDQDGIAEWKGMLVPAWTIGKAKGPDGRRVNWLKKIEDAGWDGVVVSGARTAEHSEELCWAMCDAPSCPGRCAGRSSNHVIESKTDWGALDVSEYTVFGQKAREVGAPLRNDLPIDPVHYSPDGH